MNRSSRPPLEHPSPASRARFLAAAARQVATPPGSWRKRLIVSGLVAVLPCGIRIEGLDVAAVARLARHLS